MPLSIQYKLVCPAYARLKKARYAALERLRAEFDAYEDNSIPVRYYKHKGQWYAKPITGGTAQKLKMKGMHRHGKKWRVQKNRSKGHFMRWTYDTLWEDQRTIDMVSS